ncbi:16S rRNA (guanine(966)-N(2))-methyltransferase RsmD [Geoalkalibacter sp.]|uniref:16S rRNA (guanine(966)-N(2))-methyltransferase RsmD n=1 Tax=Geoalkalibacter sp. TaxID=3041440 RepID=UPI00272EB029|nr:16S rRNA (guanine(966)-N(2))-methyltransferase RsmD [Geoalkalibacter sp.]
MRIISGSARGIRLATFGGREIRPTSDRVREALFSILYSRLGELHGKTVLDLFAGTGALSLEALSRGAASALTVDAGLQAAQTIAANARACRLEGRLTHVRGEIAAVLPRLGGRQAFDVIFLDPPYGRGLLDQTLLQIDHLGLLKPSGLICGEAGARDAVADVAGALRRDDHRIYGSTAIHFFSYPEEGSTQE